MATQRFQTSGTRHIVWQDHVWRKLKIGWKCVTCGAFTVSLPPRYPTDQLWMPQRYVPIEPEDRAITGIPELN